MLDHPSAFGETPGGVPMSKRLILCCDGTWNTAEQKSPTNVTKLYDALKTAVGLQA